MAILAASITTIGGKPILSRQFHSLTKDRVIELLSNFQNLVSTASKNHTFIEDDHVRFVYKPFDDYYIILLTNKQSNIIQDLQTLNIFADCINDYLNGYNEFEIFNNAFQILSIFDEIVTMGGLLENVTASQVETYLKMESYEEKIQDIIEKNKEIEATEERKRRAKEIARREQMKKLGNDFGLNDLQPQFQHSNNDTSNLNNALNSYYSNASPAAQQSYQNQIHSQQNTFAHTTTTPTANRANNGMKLSRTSTTPSTRRQISSNTFTSSSSAPPVVEKIKPKNNGILITVNENLKTSLTREGDVQNSELKGALELRINNEELSHTMIKLNDKDLINNRKYKFETHPNIDKKTFLNDALISLKDKSKSFPANDQSRSLLRWRKIGNMDDNSLVPILFTTWVSENTDSNNNTNNSLYDLTIEININDELVDNIDSIKNLLFTIPILPQIDIKINEDNNDCNAQIISINDEQGVIIKIDEITIDHTDTANNNFVFGLTVDAETEESIFPIDIAFDCKTLKSLIGIEIDSVLDSTNNEPLPYDVINQISTNDFAIM